MPSIARRTRVKAIFADAIERPAAQRQAFVERTCADDAGVKTEVLRLLRLHDEATPVENITPLPQRETVGDHFGRYRLVELIGEGGFGSVYLAEQQQPVRRNVALKIIKLGMDTKQVIARFEQERQALAVMDHPNIAKVFDAGATETGRPYFVMDLVRGVPITEYCDRNNLTTRQRLELFTDVCSAVQHAHHKGIIHRDIKASNVLVTVQDEDKRIVKVIDFGIAKATSARLTEKTLFTEFRQFVGTPQYMSPEQAEIGPGAMADVDTRTDIYSLGVLLYELLTGTTPFDAERLRSAAYGEMQRILREEEPPRPSTRIGTLADASKQGAQVRGAEPSRLRRDLRGDLDWIVMKALEKDRARRYDTASAFADDVRRHLADEPVLASPARQVYRMRKFVRRHRTAVLTVALVAASLAVGAVMSGIGFVRANRALACEQAARSDAEARRVVAERQTRIAQEVNDFLNDDLLASVDPENRGRDVTVLQVLEAASGNIEGRFDGMPAVEASVRATLGNTYWKLGELKSAEAHLLRALELHRAKFGDDGAETLTSMNRLAGLYRAQGRWSEAEPMYVAILDKRKRLLGETDPLTLSSMGNLAGLYRERGRFDLAMPLYQEAGVLSRALHPDSPQRINAAEGLAGMYKDLGRYSEAEPLYLEVLATHRRERGDDHPATLRTMNNLAVVHRRIGRYDRAEALYLEALASQEKRLTERHPITLVCMSNLAKLYLESREYEKAEALYKRALGLSREVLGEQHRGTLITLSGLSNLHAQQRRFADAEHLAREALAMAIHLDGEQSVTALMMKHDLATIYVKSDRPDDAVPLAAQAIAGARRALPANHWFLGAFLDTHGRALMMQAKYDDAEKALLESHDILLRSLGAGSDQTVDTVRSLLQLYESTNNATEAARWRARLEPRAPTSRPDPDIPGLQE
jgi:serine/threonine protein kinase/tetratricopeptide (TPR) repeat protein